jgi:hypothetical protein
MGKKRKYNVTPGGHEVRSEHGRKVLHEWKERTPGQGKITHGAQSETYRKRFDDQRTAQGKALAEALSALMDHFGGPANITAPMQLLIDSGIRPKLITLMCINDFITKQKSIISSDGELIPCLGRNYISFSNALRLDLQTLLDMAKTDGRKTKIPRIEDIIRGGKK